MKTQLPRNFVLCGRLRYILGSIKDEYSLYITEYLPYLCPAIAESGDQNFDYQAFRTGFHPIFSPKSILSMLDDKDLEKEEGQETPENQAEETPAEAEDKAAADQTAESETKTEAEEAAESEVKTEVKTEAKPETEEAAETAAPETEAAEEEKTEEVETPQAETEAADEKTAAEEATETTAPQAEAEASKEEEASDEGDSDESEAADENDSSEEEDSDEEEEEEEEEPVVAETAHDDFDWGVDRRSGLSYTEDKREELEKQYDSTLTSVIENEIVKGKVTAISDGDVVLDINFKSDGLVSLSEFRDTPDLDMGDEVDVYVEQQEDARGQLVLSRRKAKLLRAWENIVDSYENGTVIKGTVISKTKGGLIVDCSGLETFLPGSQIDIKPIIDYDSYVGKTMDFKVVKINEQIKNAVVSHKALIESDLAEQREAIIASLEKGQVLEGLVKNITDFGAFLDLGGVDGLLYITDISWGRISHPSEVLSLNQKINVVVLDFDENKKRISLGLKQLQPHPWATLDEEFTEGSVTRGKIVNIEDYGAFLEIKPGVEGLIHVSEVSWSNQPINAREYFKLGQEYDAKIVTIDREDRKMSLSIKQLSQDPWSDIEKRFPEGSHHSGEVKNLTPYGVFVELEEGIGGMIHISDLSWTKRYSHPSEFTKVGETIDIMILDIDKDNRKLSLGHKQLEENPWDTFENVFPVGSYHEATVVRKDDRGAIVQMPYGLEAFAPIKHIRKEDGQLAEVEETLTVKVIEFNRDDKRILVSHLRYLDDIRREAETEVRREKQKEQKQTRKAVKKQQSSVEKSTLGDLDVFNKLKDQLEDEDDNKDEKKED
jgi:small subunit ribosomal protein S1